MKRENALKFYDLIGILISVPLYTAGILFLGTSISAAVFVFHVVIAPLVFKYSKFFRRTLVFANFVQWPMNADYEEPSKSDVEGGRNVSIEYQSKVDNCRIKIGLWHILPKSVYERVKGSFEGDIDKEELNKIMDNELATSKKPVVLYCHGNSNNRATAHRILLYKVFQKMDFHTITFDYRGYGDSTKINPSEAGVVEDALVVYEWLVNTARAHENTPIFVWGHSLGTGISSALLGNLGDLSWTLLERDPLPLPNGLILEAPFSNLADEVRKHPLSAMVTWLPYYDATFIEPFRYHPEQRFTSDENLAKVTSLPVLILHAKDDVVVPFLTGLKLYKAILISRSKGDAQVKFHAYEKKENLGHKYICMAKDLPEVVGDFVKNNL